MFMLVCVPEPVCHTASGNSPSCRAAIISLLVTALAALALWREPYPLDALRGQSRMFAALVAVLAVGYSWFFVALGASTPGLALAGLRLRTLHGTAPGPQLAFARALLCLVSAVGLFGFLLALFDVRSQTLHDKLCGCVLETAP